ncbi:hypothetical protein PI124_g4926 [Phytophthora idaei]|nr:hypothetical protein PI125_g7909 [Phytophthora idaei]KAG3171836.1 hypothetical protein PI126_g1661 [Phytophthora idaei]KAG3250448.1 hypothetical protein PI124_g4926 [Phytophthora idaei]
MCVNVKPLEPSLLRAIHWRRFAQLQAISERYACQRRLGCVVAAEPRQPTDTSEEATPSDVWLVRAWAVTSPCHPHES